VPVRAVVCRDGDTPSTVELVPSEWYGRASNQRGLATV
jgi:hypothetical protein